MSNADASTADTSTQAANNNNKDDDNASDGE
jgi:hypothetical protein